MLFGSVCVDCRYSEQGTKIEYFEFFKSPIGLSGSNSAILQVAYNYLVLMSTSGDETGLSSPPKNEREKKMFFRLAFGAEISSKMPRASSIMV